MRHATGIRADVRMKREGDTRRPADKDRVIGSETHRRRKYGPRKREREGENAAGTHGGSHAHARVGLHMTRSGCIRRLFPSRDCPPLRPSSSPALSGSPEFNSNRVVSPRRAVLRGCYSTRARKYATGSDVCVDDALRRTLTAGADRSGKSNRKPVAPKFLRAESRYRQKVAIT